MTAKPSPSRQECKRSNPALEPFDDFQPVDEFEVSVTVDEGGDADRFHVTSIEPRPRR